jgi:hypothetical protein
MYNTLHPDVYDAMFGKLGANERNKLEFLTRLLGHKAGPFTGRVKQEALVATP